MIVTETAAKAMLCCGSETCGVKHSAQRWCAGRGCMAWRETKAGSPARTDENNNPIQAIPAEGFCGLAGAPA